MRGWRKGKKGRLKGKEDRDKANKINHSQEGDRIL